MRALGLEAVLIGNVSQLDFTTILAGVLELTLDFQSGFFSSDVLQGATLVGDDAVTSLVRPLVGAIWIDVARLLQDGDGLSLPLGSRQRDREQGKEYLKSRNLLDNFFKFYYFLASLEGKYGEYHVVDLDSIKRIESRRYCRETCSIK